jgi:hypothetical protein
VRDGYIEGGITVSLTRGIKKDYDPWQKNQAIVKD